MYIIGPMTSSPGPALKAWRQKEGLTQEGLAKLLGVDQSFVSLLEAGRHEPRASLGERLRKLTKGEVIWESPPSEAVAQPQSGRKRAV